MSTVRAPRIVAALAAFALAVVLSVSEILGATACGATGGAIGRGVLEALPSVLELAKKICTSGEPWDRCLQKCEACARGENVPHVDNAGGSDAGP